MAEYKAVKLMHNGNEYCFPTGCEYGYIDLLVVGGGGAGGYGRNTAEAGGGGGGGGVIYCSCLPISTGTDCCPVSVGAGGVDCNTCSDNYELHKGGDSYFGNPLPGSEYYAYGGGNGGYAYCTVGAGAFPGGSGGGGKTSPSNQRTAGCGTCGQGWYGGPGGVYGGGGGGGRNGSGWSGNINCSCTGKGGSGILSSISGQECTYGSGGGGGITCCGNLCGRTGGIGGVGAGNGGDYLKNGCPATVYGGGGGGSGACTSNTTRAGGRGCQGVVYIRYRTDGSSGILPSSTGGTRYTCGNYTIHRFSTVGSVCYFHPVFKK